MRTAILVLSFGPLAIAPGQVPCAPQWVPVLERSGVDRGIECSTMWDPDGAGPLQPRLVVGGSFTVAGGTMAARVAVFDFATSSWSTLGSGFAVTAGWFEFNPPIPSNVKTLHALPNGDLYAGGQFTHADGKPAGNVARWNGTSWQPLGRGTNGPVTALAALPNGDIAAVGMFDTAGGLSAGGAARWNGSAWQPMPGLGLSPFTTRVTACLRSNGELIASQSSAFPPFSYSCTVSRWTGSGWALLGAVPLRYCSVLTELADGTLLAGGLADNGISCVQSWNGVAWSAFGANPVLEDAMVLRQLADGSVLAGTQNLATNSYSIRAASGSTGSWSIWATCSAKVGTIQQLAGGDVLAGGAFTTIDGARVDRIGRKNGAGWQDLVAATNGSVRSAVATPTGYAVAGDFTSIAGVVANRAAMWDGVAWQPLGSGLDGPAVEIVRRSMGDLIVRGSFTTAGGVAVPGLARWNGSAWSSLGYTGLAPTRLVVMPNDDVIVAGFSGLVGGQGTGSFQRWNGSGWTTMPGSPNGAVLCMMTLPNGDLAVGGWFGWLGVTANRVARWNGLAWSSYGSGLDRPPNDLAVSPTGQLLVAGSFYFTGRLSVAARWNGTTWQPEGPPNAISGSAGNMIAALPNDEVLVAGGIFEAGGLPMRNVVRLANGVWWPVGASPAPYYGTSDNSAYGGTSGVLAKTPLANGDLLLTGTFSELAGIPTPGFMRLTPGCSPTTAALPTGCIGPFGPMVAIATSAPSLGGTLTTQCSGFGPLSFAFAVYSFRHYDLPAFTLANATPLAVRGSQLIPWADFPTLVVPSGGVATCSLALPGSLAFVGLELWHQFAQLETDAGGSLRSVSVSNGLQFSLQ